ncbi:class I tRNA ligase family protein [Actinokineospora enzanensis]|uniref:class I tRNA ligase family protein n=1 Tax=Actinokineospora enzanensis TaxID=155975 RepID=UPI00036ED60A|nr:class I tRNA ligase family protein [Actinokineospora enzanensis]
MTRRPAVVIDTSPTPNGDLHIGHLAGPFLGADVHARYLRARGRTVVFSTGTDDSQTYLVPSAARQGTTPEELAARSHDAIGRTLELAGISIDGYAPYDDDYRENAYRFVTELHDKDKLELRTVSFPCRSDTGEVLVEGFVAGYCPVCVSESRGGVCEMCGHPNNFDQLLDPWSTVAPDVPVVTKQFEVLVLPMERYRTELTAFYEARTAELRPRTLQFLREALARPLPDFPVTYPLSYGLPSPLPGTEGQVLNAWVEGIPAAMYCTRFAARELGGDVAEVDLWLAEQDPEIIYFIGSDIVYFWCLTHLALLMAHDGRYALPDKIISNEFYELDNDKFSTTRGRVVYIGELLERLSRDAVRFHLALTGPEHQRTTFGREAVERVTDTRLVHPWNELADALDAVPAEGELPVGEDARLRVRAMLDRFIDCYEAEHYSPSRAADLVDAQLNRLTRAAREGAQAGDLFLQVRALIAGASPILVDLAERARAAGGWDGTLDPADYEVDTVRPFEVPRLTPAAPVT